MSESSGNYSGYGSHGGGFNQYGDTSLGSAVPVAHHPPSSFYVYDDQSSECSAAPAPTAAGPAGLSHVLNYYNTGRPSPCCLLSSRAVVLTLNCLAFIFCILSIGAPFANGTVFQKCETSSSGRTTCYFPWPFDDSYYTGQFWALEDWAMFVAFAGAVVMATGFVLFIPTLILSVIFLHIGRQYPEQELEDGALSLGERRDRALARVYYDVNITRALFATTLLSVCMCIAGTVLYFVDWEKEVKFSKAVVGPVMALVAAVLYLVALILTPIRAATNASLYFPEEGRSSNGGEGCCYFSCGDESCCLTCCGGC
ncbi:hypothetical protein AGDE_16459 [Angomonas deanei]|uniref:Amastin surface glycoprotein n=1 Tax=Angomonas deanei TaxID=59799 RepID=A0A7G2C2W5_9TRYP|nr:hypothetical protein AGDE_16459 [Angomonas deanei]CAD2213845.1 hypothetical protein, conserved [Angomonas deanei]|eukprot:EPY17051.1 hypothetical protein AGDE_16459 [Angomonas deanei]